MLILMFKINMHETFITCIKSRDEIRDKNVRVYIYILTECESL